MVDTSNKVFDEFAKLMTDAADVAQGVKREAENVVQAQAERFMSQMDMVTREEFDAVKAMAIKARDENEALLARIEALEAQAEKK